MTNIQVKTVTVLTCFCLLLSQNLDPDFKCPSPDGMFPSPTSCKEYYNCVNDQAWKYECPAETLWDDTTKLVYIISLLFYNILLYYYYIIIILLLYYYL